MQPFESLFARISAELHRSVGHTLFTASYTLPGGREVERIYTSLPAAYPVGGRKPVHQTDWNTIMVSGRCFVASSPAGFGPHFEDLDTIVALGFGAVINIPVLHQGRMLGSLNLLDREGAYQGDVLPACDAVRPLALQAYLAYEDAMSRQPR